MPKGIVIGILAAVCLMIGCTGNKAQMLQLLEELFYGRAAPCLGDL